MIIYDCIWIYDSIKRILIANCKNVSLTVAPNDIRIFPMLKAFSFQTGKRCKKT